MSGEFHEAYIDLTTEVAEAAKNWVWHEEATGIPIRKDDRKAIKTELVNAVNALVEWEQDL